MPVGIPKTIAVKITSGVKGQAISAINRNNGDVLHDTLGATAQALFDLQNFKNGYTAGHIIDFVVTGEQVGSKSLTTSGDGDQTVTIPTSALTTGVARGI